MHANPWLVNTAAHHRNLALAELHRTARYEDSQQNVVSTAHDDHFASWSLDELADWASEPQAHREVTVVQDDTWKFVTENPHSSSRGGGGKSCQACVNCRKSKIKCTRVASLDVCDRCFAKGLPCTRPLPKRKSRPTETQQRTKVKAEPVTQISTAAPGQIQSSSAPDQASSQKKQKIASPFKDQVIEKVNEVCTFLRTSAASVGAGINGALEDVHDLLYKRIGHPCKGRMWLAAHMLLRQRVVQRSRNSRLVLDASWIDNPQMVQNAFSSFFTAKLGHVKERFIENAQNSVEAQALIWQMSLQQMRETTSWMPSQMCQLNGPDAVFQTACVIGEVSKYSNAAWDQLFRNKDELHKFMESNPESFKSPLCEVGLFALVGILNPEEEKALAKRYFWGVLGQGFKCYSDANSSEIAHYIWTIEFEATCRDKYGNVIECGFWIQSCLQNAGGLVSRSVRAIPAPKDLNTMVTEEAGTAPTRTLPATVTFVHSDNSVR